MFIVVNILVIHIFLVLLLFLLQIKAVKITLQWVCLYVSQADISLHIRCDKLPHTIQSYASLQSFFFSLSFRFLSAKKYRSCHTSMIHQACCSIWRSSWHFNSLLQWFYSLIKYSYHTYIQISSQVVGLRIDGLTKHRELVYP